MSQPTIKNIVVISDTHSGCRLSLCPPKGCALDDGGRYIPSEFQRKIWAYWREFWDDFVPEATEGEPFILVHNGDAIEGVHHGATTQISHNLEDQINLAHEILAPVVAKATRYYHIRGTEAHVGQSAVFEERLAKMLGAVPNKEGQRARYDLWIEMARGNLVHFLHHVGTVSSQAYEATAVHKELTEAFLEAARWGEEPPAMIVRSHRHRNIMTSIPFGKGRATAVVTPAWQGKTPFAWKIAGARQTAPQFGGIVIRVHKKGPIYTREYVQSIGRSELES